VLVAFLGLTAIALNRAFRDSAETAVEEQLKGHIYALLGAAEVDAEGRLRFPIELPDPRFSKPDSGLYAQVEGEGGAFKWHSPSMVGRSMQQIYQVKPGEWQFRRTSAPDDLFVINFRVLWENNEGSELAYSLTVSESTAGLVSQVESFRLTMFLWLGGSALILLIVQVAVLNWGLSPLRQVAVDLKRIEGGDANALEGEYPRELIGLTQNINSLIDHGRTRQERYRNSLGDLAHSLKTPLAVLQGAMDADDDESMRLALREQLPRMDDIVRYQLQRASVSGRSDVTRAQAVPPVVAKIVATLQKVYRDKKVECIQKMDANARFFGDEGDLMEFLGNLLENAFKYCLTTVLVRVETQKVDSGIRQPLWIVIEDDGPGIPPSEQERVLGRGERQDQHLPGQGIGLSVANDIIRLYGGELEIRSSRLGGATITIAFCKVG